MTVIADRLGRATTTDRPPALAVEGLDVRYESVRGRVDAVRDVSFTVPAGGRLVIVGESGSGKTAVCLAVGGFLTQPGVSVSATRITVGGTELAGRPRRRMPTRVPGMSMIFQDAMTSLDPLWTVGQQLRAVLRSTRGCSRREARDLAVQWLGRVGLTDTRRVLRARPYELSGGMRQRVMIALALCGEPRLVVADEPTSALDASLARDVVDLLLALTEELGTGLVLVTHDIALSRDIADQMVVMYGGRVVETGPADTLHAAAAHPYTQGLLRSVPTLASAALDVLPTIPAPGGAGQHDPAGGCSFRPRCASAHDRCAAPPPLLPGPDGVQAACWLLAPVRS